MTEDRFYATFNTDGFANGFYQSAAMSDPAVIPSEAIELSGEQFSDLCEYAGLRRWDGTKIVAFDPPAPEPVVPDVVSSRQFFLQLATAGLFTQVEAWVGQQDPLVQIAFNKSATFRRDDEMLQQGFSGLGFSTADVDQFFTAAAAL